MWCGPCENYMSVYRGPQSCQIVSCDHDIPLQLPQYVLINNKPTERRHDDERHEALADARALDCRNDRGAVVRCTDPAVGEAACKTAAVVLHSHEFTVRFFVFLLKTPPTYIYKHVPLLAFF